MWWEVPLAFAKMCGAVVGVVLVIGVSGLVVWLAAKAAFAVVDRVNEREGE